MPDAQAWLPSGVSVAEGDGDELVWVASIPLEDAENEVGSDERLV